MGKIELILFVGAIFSCLLFFVLLHSPRFEKWSPLLSFTGLIVGFIGFLALIVWNAFLQKKSFGRLNAFLTVWMFCFLMLKAFFGGAL